MRRSGHPRRTRILAAGAVLVAAAGVIGFTQFASADDTANTRAATESGAGKVVGNNLTILTDTCIDSQLEAHDGFQKGNRCVSTEFGEVGSAANNPTLLITEAPRNVTVGAPFTLRISTRNLIRDRFLAAGQGGYYVESSVLQNGLVRGHFHTACRMLTSTNEAPDPAPVPAFFVATEDSRGNATPDTVTIQVPGLPQEGTAQCSSWAGDGSHRIPMMERANQTPALDSVRVTVRAAGNNNGGNNNGGGNNGGGGNNNAGGGNNNGGGNNTNSGEVKPTKPAATNPATTNPTKAPTTKATTKATTPPRTNATTPDSETRDDEGTATSNNENNSGSENSENSGTENSGTETEAEETATPKATKKAKPQPTETDGPALAAGEDDGAPDDFQYEAADPDKTLAEPPAEQSGPLALISNNLAWVGGGAVFLLIALIALAFARSRPRNNWR